MILVNPHLNVAFTVLLTSPCSPIRIYNDSPMLMYNIDISSSSSNHDFDLIRFAMRSKLFPSGCKSI